MGFESQSTRQESVDHYSSKAIAERLSKLDDRLKSIVDAAFSLNDVNLIEQIINDPAYLDGLNSDQRIRVAEYLGELKSSENDSDRKKFAKDLAKFIYTALG